MTFEQCCEIVACECPNAYAKAYAVAGLQQLPKMYHGEMLRDAQRMQANYILCNIGHWRGANAKLVRAALKSHAKGKGNA